MKIWLDHPRTKQADTMLTLAVAGFIFSGVVVSATLVYTFVTGQELENMSAVATLVASILTPSLGSYTIRKYTDFKKNSSNNINKRK